MITVTKDKVKVTRRGVTNV